LVDLAVMRYLYYKYPEADSGQLSAARSRAVCNPALACLAVKRLDLHKVLLVNNVELSTAIARHVPVLEQISFADIVAKGWKYDPPKALGDVFESVLGALFVDSGYNFERSSAIIEILMEDLLPELSLDLEKDPVSGLMVWAAQKGCRRISYQCVDFI
jgi:endoribonuclease Dicer